MEEQDDDTEYNFWADKPVDEKEEFRNDRAVRIPRTLTQLVAEFRQILVKQFLLQLTKCCCCLL